jgi:hypothetical protein
MVAIAAGTDVAVKTGDVVLVLTISRFARI